MDECKSAMNGQESEGMSRAERRKCENIKNELRGEAEGRQEISGVSRRKGPHI